MSGEGLVLIGGGGVGVLVDDRRVLDIGDVDREGGVQLEIVQVPDAESDASLSIEVEHRQEADAEVARGGRGRKVTDGQAAPGAASSRTAQCEPENVTGMAVHHVHAIGGCDGHGVAIDVDGGGHESRGGFRLGEFGAEGKPAIGGQLHFGLAEEFAGSSGEGHRFVDGDRGATGARTAPVARGVGALESRNVGHVGDGSVL